MPGKQGKSQNPKNNHFFIEFFPKNFDKYWMPVENNPPLMCTTIVTRFLFTIFSGEDGIFPGGTPLQ
jgi:ABC-type phosphate/phosphonate transport system permease subunit